MDYLGAIGTLELRRVQLENSITEFVPSSPYAQTVARLRCLRGIDTLSAVGLCAEIGDFTWQAQRRLHNVWCRLADQRGKRRTIVAVAVAVARELAGFCWALARAD